MASKKLNTNAIIALAVAIVGLVLVIVGITLDWLSTTVSFGGMSMTESVKLGDMAKMDGLNEVSGYSAMVAFAYITLSAGIIAVIAAAVSAFIDMKLVKTVAIGAGAVALVCAILTIIFEFVFCNAEGMKTEVSTNMPAIGAWLLVIGGVICGAGSAAVAKANK